MSDLLLSLKMIIFDAACVTFSCQIVNLIDMIESLNRLLDLDVALLGNSWYLTCDAFALFAYLYVSVNECN